MYKQDGGEGFFDLFYCPDLDFDERELGEALDLMPDFWRIDKTGFADELLSRLNNAGANSYFIGNSANHFIPCNLRPNWKVFIDTLALKAGRMLKDSLV